VLRIFRHSLRHLLPIVLCSSSLLPPSTATVSVGMNRCTRVIQRLHSFRYRCIVRHRILTDFTISFLPRLLGARDHLKITYRGENRREERTLCQIFRAVTSWNILWRGNSMRYHNVPFYREHIKVSKRGSIFQVFLLNTLFYAFVFLIFNIVIKLRDKFAAW